MLGSVVSTITVGLLEWRRGDRLHFDLPELKRDCVPVVAALRKSVRSKVLRKRLLAAAETWLKQEAPDRLSKKDRSGLGALLFPLHNLALRIHAPKQLLNFTVRRWTIFWSHADSVGAVLLGFVGACAVRLFNEYEVFAGQVFSGRKAAWEALWLVYLLIACANAKKARREAIEIVRDWLMEFAAGPGRGTGSTSAHESSPPASSGSSTADT